jgi:hypothetical protein
MLRYTSCKTQRKPPYEKGNITPIANQLLKKILSQAAANNTIPSKYLDEKMQDTFLLQYIDKIKDKPACANLIYLINTDSQHSNHFYSLSLLANVVEEDKIYSFSFGAIDLLGKEIFQENWVRKQYRLGTLTREQIEDGQRFANTRLASISVPGIKLPESVHDVLVHIDDISQHDEYHREQSSMIPKEMRAALDRINLIARQQLGFYWTSEIWLLVDRDPGIACPDPCKEKKFYQLLTRICYTLDVENETLTREEIKKSNPTLPRGLLFNKKIELRKKLNASRKLVFNKNSTSVFI